MTKDKVRELNAMTGGRLVGSETLPTDGLYMISATQDSDLIRKSAESAGVDYFMMGMVIPPSKAAAVCQLLQDDAGLMPSPVIMLKRTTSQTESVAASRINTTVPGMSRITGSGKGSMHEVSSIHIKNIEITPGRHEVKVSGKIVVLTFSEFRILQSLASKPGWVFSREQIIHAVHGDNYNCTERAVDVQVTGLRKKLGSAGDFIETVRGVGYRFVE